MDLIVSSRDLTAYLDPLRGLDKKIGYIPTMGALHDGHLSLIRRAKQGCDLVVVSIYVNPTQFGENEDFSTYPRQLESDLSVLEREAVDCVFVPTDADIYPEGSDNVKQISVPVLSTLYCGKTRPHFFDGVCTVVYRLFQLVGPDNAFFGEKDFQQLTIIKRMVMEFSLPVDVLGCPIVRETDGLAMSSRNQYLSAGDRATATQVYAVLQAARQQFSEGNTDPQKIKSLALEKMPDLRLDYAEIVDSTTLAPVERVSETSRFLIAAYCGDVRLIDNMGFK